MIDDVRVLNASDFPSEEMFAKVTSACDLIRTVAPRSWSRLRHDVRRIFVLDGGGQEYWHEGRAIVLNGPILRRSSTDAVALVLVHEATHARIAARGIGYPVALRERIEHICVDAEIAFAERLPDAAQLVEALRVKRTHVWWTPEQVAERRHRAFAELRLPGWFRWLFR
jgi:hypothetical protein